MSNRDQGAIGVLTNPHYYPDKFIPDIASEQSFEKVLIQQQQANLLQVAIAALPTRQRNTMSMRINQQLSFADIARVMHCSMSTAKANHCYGVKAAGQMMTA